MGPLGGCLGRFCWRHARRRVSWRRGIHRRPTRHSFSCGPVFHIFVAVCPVAHSTVVRNHVGRCRSPYCRAARRRGFCCAAVSRAIAFPSSPPFSPPPAPATRGPAPPAPHLPGRCPPSALNPAASSPDAKLPATPFLPRPQRPLWQPPRSAELRPSSWPWFVLRGPLSSSGSPLARQSSLQRPEWRLRKHSRPP